MTIELDEQTYATLAGPILDQEEFAAALGTTVKGVRSALSDQRIVGVKVGTPKVLHIPEAFLIEAHRANPADLKPEVDAGKRVILPSIQGTIIMLRDMGLNDHEIVIWLFTEHEELGDTPVAMLRSGNRSAVRRAAQSLL